MKFDPIVKTLTYRGEGDRSWQAGGAISNFTVSKTWYWHVILYGANSTATILPATESEFISDPKKEEIALGSPLDMFGGGAAKTGSY